MFHEGLWKQVLELDRQDTAQRAICNYDLDADSFAITMLNCEYQVEMGKRDIFRLQSGSEKVQAGFIEQLCILSYLIKSSQLPASNKLVKAESLPGGAFFFRGPHELPTGKLEDVAWHVNSIAQGQFHGTLTKERPASPGVADLRAVGHQVTCSYTVRDI